MQHHATPPGLRCDSDPLRGGLLVGVTRWDFLPIVVVFGACLSLNPFCCMGFDDYDWVLKGIL